VYESKFCNVYGATLCFGGPHEVFTKGYKQAGFRVKTEMLQVLFTELASAYMGGIHAVVGASIEDEEAADSLPNAPPAIITAQLGSGGDAVPEGVIPRPEPPILLELSKDSAEPDGASPTEPDRSNSAEPHRATETAVSDQSEPASATAQPDPPPSALEPTVKPYAPAAVGAETDQTLSAIAPDLDEEPDKVDPANTGTIADTTVIGQPEPEANPIEPDLLPSMPEPSTKLDDQAIASTIQPNLPLTLTDETSVEAVTQGFTAVTVGATDKPPDQPTKSQTPRTFNDEDCKCYYVTTDYGSSDDEQKGGKPPSRKCYRVLKMRQQPHLL
jgi:hypothetical protein